MGVPPPPDASKPVGPFQRHVCDQKSGKFHFWMATAPGANMLLTSFWLIIVRPVRVKTYRSLKIKFFVKVKNKVHVTIGHVCDFARNYGPAPNDFKVKILWCVMEFCIEQYTDEGQYIYKQFHILRRMKFYRQDFFWCNILFGHVCDILVNAWVTFVTFLIKIMCSLMHGQKSFTIFVLEILLKYQVTNWWLKNLLMGPIKKLIFPWNQQKFHFPWNGPFDLLEIEIIMLR